MEASIIIPFYNAENYLQKNFNHAQKLIKRINNIEIIYIDDASTDKGHETLALKVKNYNQIKLYKNSKNRGPGIARNLGLKKANGKKIFFLDIDDHFNIVNLKLFLEKFKNTNDNIFFNYHIKPKNMNYFKNNPVSKSYKKNLEDFLLNTNDKNIIFTCFNRNFLLKNKIFFPSGFHEDIIFKFKALFFSKRPFKKYNRIIYHKFDNKFSITGKNFDEKNLRGFIKAWQDIRRFIKTNNLNFLKDGYQYRIRGEYVNLYDKILKNSHKKKDLILLLNHKFLPFIKKKFVINSKKDYVFLKLLSNYEKI